MDIFSLSQESLWLITVVYDLGLALLLYRFFGKYGLYVAVVLGIVLGNLQGGKVSEEQPKIAQPDNQQIEMASEENPALLGQQKEVNIKDFEEKDNFK